MTAQRFPVKRLPDGRAMINLGSSAHTAAGWNNIDFSWIVRIGRHRRLSRLLNRVGLISAARYQRIQRMDPDTVLWDLSKGVPYADQTFDVVYHSHVLEHIDREYAAGFMAECHRVLRPGGLLRVVVPDLEQMARRYLSALDSSETQETLRLHCEATDEIFDQMVRRRPKLRDQQPLINRLLEAVLIGDNSKSGTMHRWMYDRMSLAQLMRQAGFQEVRRYTAVTSGIEGWPSFLLDAEADGTPCRHNTPRSLYMECRRPPLAQPIHTLAA